MNDDVIQMERYSYWQIMPKVYNVFTSDKEVRDFIKKMGCDIAYYIKDRKKIGWQGILTSNDLRFLKKQFPNSKDSEKTV